MKLKQTKSLIRKLFSSIAKIWHRPIHEIEKKRIRHYASVGEKHQPIFIIGAPRTGSTILYQILTNKFDVLYIDNLVDTFYRNLYFGFWIDNLFFDGKPHNCFKSYHGNTLQYGFHAPAECGAFWYRWLPKERHYVAKGEMPKEVIKEIKENIFSVINRYNKPFIFKNLNAGQRMGLIYEIAPGAKFIFIKRDPLYTAQSILQSKRRVGKKGNEWWSIKPKNYKKLEKLNTYEQIVKQIFFLEKQIIEDYKLFDPQNFLIVHYSELCKKSEDIISKIHKFIGEYVGERIGVIPANIKKSEKKTINDKEFERLRKEIQKLDWNTYECF